MITFVSRLEDGVSVHRYQKWHLKAMKKQFEQHNMTEINIPVLDLDNEDLAFTVFSPSGEILSCLGVSTFAGNTVSWAVNSKAFFKYARPISRIVNKFFEELGRLRSFNVIYGSSRVGWRPGRTWLKMIGFTPLPDKFKLANSTYRLYERELF